jgi:hypothetical protein
MTGLRPPAQSSLARLGERINAPIHTFKPPINVAMKDLRRLWDGWLKIAWTPKPKTDLGRAGKRLLTVSRHDGGARSAAPHGVSVPSFMLLDNARAAAMIASRHRRVWTGYDFDAARLRDSQQTESEPPAKFTYPRIAFASVSPGRTHGKPDFVADISAINALQEEIEIKGKFQFANDDNWGRARGNRHEIAAADFALHMKTKAFQKSLDRQIEAGFHGHGNVRSTRLVGPKRTFRLFGVSRKRILRADEAGFVSFRCMRRIHFTTPL